jgi:hypothetical protein
MPFHRVDWMLRLFAHHLGGWVLLEIFEYLGTFSVLIAVVFYYAEAGDRKKQKHYQAWQVINTSQGKGGSGGRIEALHELNEDHVPLVGVDASGSFLQGIRLHKANLLRCDLSSADLRDAEMPGANLAFADLESANFRNSDLRDAVLRSANLSDADLTAARLNRAELAGADLSKADLTNADLRDIRWRDIRNIDKANVFGVRNAPPGFLDWALHHGAVALQGE